MVGRSVAVTAVSFRYCHARNGTDRRWLAHVVVSKPIVQEFFKTEIVIIALVLIGVLGRLMDLALRTLQGRLARWAPRDR